ncbi:MAG: thiamine biosynthesis protein ThiF [Denitrovibrio sp.]|nr:MAG: thiamine biosynthesis protein ThiF [Denitrovibrio sp.]
MNIRVNEKQVDFIGETAGDVAASYKPDADIIIQNGHIVNRESAILDGDNIYLIKRGEKPDEQQMRYLLTARHTPKVAEKMAKTKIAVCGLGGLGSNIALALARMGVGELLLIDYDVIEPSNINRQQYYIDQIGMKKTEATLENLKRVNPYVKYDMQDVFITKELIGGLFEGCEVIIEAFDGAETKAMFIVEASRCYPDALIVGASGVAGLSSHEKFRVVSAGKNVKLVGDFETAAQVGRGLMSTRVTIAAGIQANVAVRHVLADILED